MHRAPFNVYAGESRFVAEHEQPRPASAGLLLRFPQCHNNWIMIRYLIALALVLSPVPALADITGKARVIDGDTIEVAGQRIRLHGIDAPESRQLCRRDGERWQCGKDATSALKAFLGGRPVSCDELDRDRYRRIVARCAVDGVDIGDRNVG